MRPEAAILREVLLALSSRPDCLVWRNNKGRACDRFGQWVQFGGPDGAADILGVVGPGGRFLAVEVKSERGRQRPEQKVFEQQVLARGGIYVLARSVDDAVSALEAALADS